MDVKVGQVWRYTDGDEFEVVEVRGDILALRGCSRNIVPWTVSKMERYEDNWKLLDGHTPDTIMAALLPVLREHRIDAERIRIDSDGIRVLGLDLGFGALRDVAESMGVSIATDPEDTTRQADHAAAAYRRSRGWR